MDWKRWSAVLMYSMLQLVNSKIITEPGYTLPMRDAMQPLERNVTKNETEYFNDTNFAKNHSVHLKNASKYDTYTGLSEDDKTSEYRVRYGKMPRLPRVNPYFNLEQNIRIGKNEKHLMNILEENRKKGQHHLKKIKRLQTKKLWRNNKFEKIPNKLRRQKIRKHTRLLSQNSLNQAKEIGVKPRGKHWGTNRIIEGKHGGMALEKQRGAIIPHKNIQTGKIDGATMLLKDTFHVDKPPLDVDAVSWEKPITVLNYKDQSQSAKLKKRTKESADPLTVDADDKQSPGESKSTPSSKSNVTRIKIHNDKNAVIKSEQQQIHLLNYLTNKNTSLAKGAYISSITNKHKVVPFMKWIDNLKQTNAVGADLLNALEAKFKRYLKKCKANNKVRRTSEDTPKASNQHKKAARIKHANETKLHRTTRSTVTSGNKLNNRSNRTKGVNTRRKPDKKRSRKAKKKSIKKKNGKRGKVKTGGGIKLMLQAKHIQQGLDRMMKAVRSEKRRVSWILKRYQGKINSLLHGMLSGLRTRKRSQKPHRRTKRHHMWSDRMTRLITDTQTMLQNEREKLHGLPVRWESVFCENPVTVASEPKLGRSVKATSEAIPEAEVIKLD